MVAPARARGKINTPVLILFSQESVIQYEHCSSYSLCSGMYISVDVDGHIDGRNADGNVDSYTYRALGSHLAEAGPIKISLCHI